MSVLIKGMEMPKDCIFCPMFRGAWTMCAVLNKTMSARGRPEDCPLVPVPPHGRLIDADALKEYIEEWGFIGAGCAITSVDFAPTIIEAEDGE